MVLEAPSFGNTWALDFKIIGRRLLGNELKVVVDPNWPIVERLTLVYEGLSEEDKDLFLADLLTSIGLQISMTDWEENNWVGTIVSDITETENHRLCGYSLQFDFEGILQP